MFVPHTFPVALVMMITSTICWRSWANVYKLTKDYRFELAYWDFSIGVVLISFLLAWTMASTSGGELSFVNNVHAAAASNLVYALVGAFIFNIASVLLVAGIGLTGLAIAFSLSIGIALVEGIVLSYAVQPKGNARLLALGVAMAVLAVILIGKAYGNLHRSGRAASRKGVGICIVSRFLMGAFAPFEARALTSAHPLTPYGIAVFFAIGVFLSCLVFNTYLMRRPLTGTPVDFLEYFRVAPSQHWIGLAGGVVWGVGMVFNLTAASLGASLSPARWAKPRPWSQRSGVYWFFMNFAVLGTAPSSTWRQCL
ncbi:MAG: AcrB/AcrD/AcrF family protein [Acidobacteriaceae bacterium]